MILTQPIAPRETLAALGHLDLPCYSLSALFFSRGRAGGARVLLKSQLAHTRLKELGEGLTGPVLRGGASVVLYAVGEDKAHVVKKFGRGGVPILVNFVPDGG